MGNGLTAGEQYQALARQALYSRLAAMEAELAKDEAGTPDERLARLEAKIAAEARSRRTTRTTTTGTGGKAEARVSVERNAGRVSEVIAGSRAEAEAFSQKLRDIDALKVSRKAKLEIRSANGGPSIAGYAAVWNARSAPLYEDGIKFVEQIAQGAFAASLTRGDPVVLLIEHKDLPLASTKSGTLALNEDHKGLRFRSQLDPDDPDVRRLTPKVKRGDMAKCSFSFVVERDVWDIRQNPPLRTVMDGALRDVSIVTRPAYGATSCAVSGV